MVEQLTSQAIVMTYPLPAHITTKHGQMIATSVKDLCTAATVVDRSLVVQIKRGTSATEVLQMGVLIGQLMSM